MKPLLLLDIDGVIAPFDDDRLSKSDKHFLVEVQGVQHWLRHDWPDIIRTLMQHYTLMWGTAWEEKANEHMLTPLGLENPLEVLSFWGECDHDIGARRLSYPYISLEPGYESWKLPWIKYFLDQDERPAVWIDDEALDDAQAYARQRSEDGKPTLFIKTDPNLGFLDEHLEELVQWADYHKEAING